MTTEFKIKVGDKKITLTVDEAKELQRLLNDVLGKRDKSLTVDVISIPVYPPCLPALPESMLPDYSPWYPCNITKTIHGETTVYGITKLQLKASVIRHEFKDEDFISADAESRVSDLNNASDFTVTKK